MLLLQYNFNPAERMHCRPPRRVKRYITDPDQYCNEHRAKYNNCTLQQLKLQVNAIDTLNDISVPAIPYQHHNHHKNNNTFMPLHSKFHLRRNPLKKLPDINTQIINNNGCELPNTIKTPQMFKKSNPLFVVNGLFDILKEDLSSDQKHPDKLKRNIKQKTKQDNEFSQFEGKSVKVHRGPRLVDSELSRLTQQSQFSRRKIYSQEKSRKKGEEVELLTFYKPKVGPVQEKNQFLS